MKAHNEGKDSPAYVIDMERSELEAQLFAAFVMGQSFLQTPSFSRIHAEFHIGMDRSQEWERTSFHYRGEGKSHVWIIRREGRCDTAKARVKKKDAKLGESNHT